jgi:hypothetical protein
MLQCFVSLAVAGLLLGLGGCNQREVRLPETGATLEGTVAYGNEKVLVAMVTATGPNASASGYIEDDGRYRIQNVPLGEVNLGVNVAAGDGQLMGKRMAGKPVPKVTKVPAKYADSTTSGVTTTIVKGPNTFDIKIPK